MPEASVPEARKMKPKLSIIAAISTNRVIGRDNKIPWHISEDLRRFKALTIGHPIIMGRKTFESIGKPLPKRANIVITRDKDYSAPGIDVAHSIEEAIEAAKTKEGSEEIFIIGGGQIYSQSIHLADKLYLTVVDQEIKGDVFFPGYFEFKKVIFEQSVEENGLAYNFIDLKR